MFDQFRDRMTAQGGQMGNALKRQSDAIMDATFTRDIAYKKCYLLDKDVIFPEQTAESYRKAKAVYAGKSEYDPRKLSGFKPIDAKYLVHTYTSISKPDSVDYYLQFRPNAHGKNPNIRVGALVFIPDDLGVYNLWMIVQRDDRPQFPQFYVLRCDFLAKWYIRDNDVPNYEGVHVDTGTYFTWCVARSQSSYNSGVWTDYLTTTVENQKILWTSTNNDTRTITYNQHFTISDNQYSRTAWEISKRDDMAPVGVTKLTLKQEQAIEIIDDLSWVNITSDELSDTEHGINYDFFKSRVNDKEQHTPADEFIVDDSIISFSGVKPSLKCGGSYKTYTANFYSGSKFIECKPYWRISYVYDDMLACTVGFTYDGDKLVPDNLGDEFVVSPDRKITCKQNGVDIFGIQYSYNIEKPNDLKIRCLSILGMVGNKVVITAFSDQSEVNTYSTSIEVEVEGL